VTVADFDAVPAAGDDFTLIVLPDPHLYDDTKGGYWADQATWIAANKAALNIQMVLSVGDWVSDGASAPSWARVDAGVATLTAAGIPLLSAMGNHDYNGAYADRIITGFLSSFPASFYTGADWFDGGMYNDSPDNVYTRLTIGGHNWLFMALEHDTRAAALTWAQSVLEAHPTYDAVIVTHYFLDQNGVITSVMYHIRDALTPPGNVRLVVCGHIPTGGESDRVDLLGNCKRMMAEFSDFQGWVNDGNGYMRIVSFKPGSRAVKVQTYSPTLNSYIQDADSEFVQSW
jgi:hypothetical protein